MVTPKHFGTVVGCLSCSILKHTCTNGDNARNSIYFREGQSAYAHTLDWEEVLPSPTGAAEAIHFCAEGDLCLPTTHGSPHPKETVPEVSTYMYS